MPCGCVYEKVLLAHVYFFTCSSETKSESYESQTGKAIHHHLNVEIISAFLPPVKLLVMSVCSQLFVDALIYRVVGTE